MDEIMNALGGIIDTIKGMVGDMDITDIIEAIKNLITNIVG